MGQEEGRAYDQESLTILLSNLPEKCDDPSMFTLPCKIGKKKLENVMIDLGAFMNGITTKFWNCDSTSRLFSYSTVRSSKRYYC